MAEEKKTATIKLYRDNVPRITITYKNKKDLYKNFQKKLKQLNLDMGEVYWADWDNDRTAIKGAEDLFAAVDNNTNVRMFYRPRANKEVFTCPSCDDEDEEVIKVEEKPVEKVTYESEENRSRSPSRSLSRGRHRSHSHDHPRHRSRSCDYHRRHRSPSGSPFPPHHRRHRSRSCSSSPDRRRGRSRSCPGRRGHHHHHGHGHRPHPPMPPCFPPWYPWFPPCPPFHPRHHSRGGHHHGRGRSRSCDRLCQEFNNTL